MAATTELWLVGVDGVGHVIKNGRGPVELLCGRRRRAASIVEREPKHVCEDCRRAVAGLPPRVRIGTDPRREDQQKLF